MTPDLPTAADQARDTLATARERATNAVSEGARCIRERPGQAVLVALGLGLVAGVLIGRALRPTPRPSALADSKEKLAELLGGMAANLRGPIGRTVSSVSDGASNLADSVSTPGTKSARRADCGIGGTNGLKPPVSPECASAERRGLYFRKGRLNRISRPFLRHAPGDGAGGGVIVAVGFTCTPSVVGGGATCAESPA